MPESSGRHRAMRPDGASDRVIVVLGYHEIGDDGWHGISSICRAAVRRAEALAAEAPPRAVIFTGWSSNGGPAEADQMAEEWRGGATSHCSASRTPSTRPRTRSARWRCCETVEGASEVVLVCSIRHFPRVRFLFDRLYRRNGYATRYRYVLGRSRRCRSSSTSCGRSPGWRGIGAVRCGCWTRRARQGSRLQDCAALARPLCRRPPRGYATALDRRRQLGSDGAVVLSPRRIGAGRRVPVARAHGPGNGA